MKGSGLRVEGPCCFLQFPLCSGALWVEGSWATSVSSSKPKRGALPEGLECRYLSLLILVHLKLNNILNELKIFATVSFVRTCLHQFSVSSCPFQEGQAYSWPFFFLFHFVVVNVFVIF